MKKSIYTFVCLLLISTGIFAQTPQAINYQGVARDNSGNVLANQMVSLKLSILSDSATGMADYIETHVKTTDGFGLFSLKIGQGSVVSGSFSTINWGGHTYYLKVEIDPAGGTAWQLVGTNQFVSVPYALYATESGNSNSWGKNGNAGTIDGTHFIGTTDNVALTFKINNQKAGRIDPAGPLFLGYQAGNGNTAATSTGIGRSALKVNTGEFNTATGRYTLSANTTGSGNSAFGANALGSNTTGYDNIAVGFNSLYFNTEGHSNAALGLHALYHNTTGYDNTAVGRAALQGNTTGIQNTATGFNALFNNSTGHENTASGFAALYANTTGYNNTAVGFQALVSNTTGFENTSTGVNALKSNTAGIYNIACGVRALYWNTTGNSNTALGWNALYSNQAGSFATAVGTNAMYYANNTATAFDNRNVAMGFEALRGSSDASLNTGNNNTAIGYLTLWNNTSGNWNTALGDQALYSNTTAYSNTALGRYALRGITTGNNNTAIGTSAGYNNITGSGNVFLGYNAGYNETGSNKLYIANSSNNPPLICGDFSTGRLGIGTTNPTTNLQIQTQGINCESILGYNGLLLQNQNVNTRTFVGIAPNGTSPNADFFIFHNSDHTTNFEYLLLGYDNDQDHFHIATVKGGSGQQRNLVLDATGRASNFWNQLALATNGNVGIGTTSPGAKLEVNGTVKITDGTQGANKVLISDADGLASWQTLPGGGTGSLPNGAAPGEMLYWNGSAWVTVPPGTNGQTLTFCNGVPTWGPCIFTDSDADGDPDFSDCVPNNPAIHHGAFEVCNGMDDDCDGVVDNGNPGGGAACNTGIPGVCAAGTTGCVDGVIVCIPVGQSSPEVCDGLDNDCNGQVDEGCNDGDGDGIPDQMDNCITVSNPDQMDTDGDAIGDACDPDIDGDGFLNGDDFAPNDPTLFPGAACDDGNVCTTDDHYDNTGNCIGSAVFCDDGDPNTLDMCDPATGACMHIPNDADVDGIADLVDNCIGVFNPDQTDTDGDHLGDACDPDIDGDGFLNGNDFAPNDPALYPGAACIDGNACTTQDVYDNAGNCIGTAVFCDDGDPNTLDMCDPATGACMHIPNDADVDGIADLVDNCIGVFNPDQTDTDGDHLGDACDPDIDGDGFLNGDDFAPNDPTLFPGAACDDGNVCTTDDHYDNTGNCIGSAVFCDDGDPNTLDMCDPATGACMHIPNDADVDGIADLVDNCIGVFNPDQTDTDGDHLGDACDPDIDGDGFLNGNDFAPNDPALYPGAACIDGNACTTQDVYDNAGNCIGTAVFCDDGDPNTLDMCDPATGACMHIPNDADVDGIADLVDNCIGVFNPDQTDTDGDHLGDACDPDIDGDGFLNGNDFAPNDPALYPGAACIDGNACTTQDVYDNAGNCIGTAVFCDDGDPNTLDMCDPATGACMHIPNDADVDGIADLVDNCIGVFNPDQTDTDGDHLGDACDPDIDGDGFLNGNDFAPNDPALYPGAACIDGNACTTQDVYDNAGNCIGTAVFCDDGDPNTLDMCDPATGACMHIPNDADVDGIADLVDNCIGVFNPDQTDTDGDHLGDACDPDIDGDGFLNGNDFAPNDPALYPGAACIDGNACTTQDVYDNAGNCIGTAVFCDDGDPNTLDMCDPVTGICLHMPTLTTTSVTNIAQTTVTSGGNVTSDGFAAVTARGICWSTSANPTIALSTKTTDGSGTGVFVSNLTGLTANTHYYVRAYATNSVGTAYGNEESFITAAVASCPSTVTDYDGNVYNTIQIGTQCWLKQNLKVTHYRNGDAIPNVTGTAAWASLNTGAYCNNNNTPGNGVTYGRLYNWFAVADSRNIAPMGWHVATDAEWTTLTNFLINNGYGFQGSGDDIGKSLATTSGWTTNPTPGTVGNDQASNNISGFTALPAGYRAFDGIFTNVGWCGFWWSTTENTTVDALGQYLFNYLSIYNKSYFNKIDGFSVRCVRD